MSLNLLTVCTGNICRSPIAEFVIGHHLRGAEGLTVSSAGTAALVDGHMDHRAQEIVQQITGADPTAHRARQITAAEVRSADLVLTATRRHRRNVVELSPRASRYTFTLREFARIAAGISSTEIHRMQMGQLMESDSGLVLVSQVVASERGMLPPVSPEEDDIVDPYRQSDRVYEAAISLILDSARVTAEFIEYFLHSRP